MNDFRFWFIFTVKKTSLLAVYFVTNKWNRWTKNTTRTFRHFFFFNEPDFFLVKWTNFCKKKNITGGLLLREL